MLFHPTNEESRTGYSTGFSSSSVASGSCGAARLASALLYHRTNWYLATSLPPRPKASAAASARPASNSPKPILTMLVGNPGLLQGHDRGEDDDGHARQQSEEPLLLQVGGQDHLCGQVRQVDADDQDDQGDQQLARGRR